MKIYEDKFGRVIWLSISPSEIRVDLQDLNPEFEYERCASVKNVNDLCTVLRIHFDDLEANLLMLLQNQGNAVDLIIKYLDEHQISFAYYSGIR